MELPAEIGKKIGSFSFMNEHEEIVNYLKLLLIQNQIKAESIFNFAKYVYFETSKTYVINSDIINKLGLLVQSLDNPEQKGWSLQFFKLAGDRGNHWGYYNYAYLGYQMWLSTDEIIHYAKKHIELAPDQFKHLSKLILFNALYSTYSIEADLNLLDEYFQYHENNLRQSLNKNVYSEQESEKAISALVHTCHIIIAPFFSTILNENNAELKEDLYRKVLLKLTPLFHMMESKYLGSIKEKFFYIKGKCHEKLGEQQEAWRAYSVFKDESSTLYLSVIDGRKNLLKKQVKFLEEEWLNQATSTLKIKEDHRESNNINEQKISLSLSETVKPPFNFINGWKKGTDWFDVVNKSAVQTEYDKRKTQLEEIRSKQSLNNENLISAALEEVQKYESYLPEERESFRRHQVEMRFFSPKHSNKLQKVVELTYQLIDQRFRDPKTSPLAINLTGKSSRLLIIAENLFQEALRSLLPKEDLNNYFLDLGISIDKRKPWSNNKGDNIYGPIENYEVIKTDNKGCEILSSTQIRSQHRVNPKNQRMGDSVQLDISNYSSIYSFLRFLTNDDGEKEKKLATWMIRYGKKHEPATLEELRALNSTINQQDADRFNQICFLILEKEQSQWLHTIYKIYQTGMALAQARCLILLQAGWLNFVDVFSNDAKFGVYSHSDIHNNPWAVVNSCKLIESLYDQYLKTTRQQEYGVFFKNSLLNGKVEHNSRHVLKRKQGKKDMYAVYTDSEESCSNDSGYDSDLSI